MIETALLKNNDLPELERNLLRLELTVHRANTLLATQRANRPVAVCVSGAGGSETSQLAKELVADLATRQIVGSVPESVAPTHVPGKTVPERSNLNFQVEMFCEALNRDIGAITEAQKQSKTGTQHAVVFNKSLYDGVTYVEAYTAAELAKIAQTIAGTDGATREQLLQAQKLITAVASKTVAALASAAAKMSPLYDVVFCTPIQKPDAEAPNRTEFDKLLVPVYPALLQRSGYTGNLQLIHPNTPAAQVHEQCKKMLFDAVDQHAVPELQPTRALGMDSRQSASVSVPTSRQPCKK